MIRSVPTSAPFTFRNGGTQNMRRGTLPPGYMGRVGGVDPVSVGLQVATTAAGMWMNSIQRSHDADTATTQIANGLSTQLQNLLAAYTAEPNVTCADQRAALDAFDQAMIWFISPQGCGNGAYGSAGNRCVSERAYPGAKYSYYTYIRDPIANDPRLTGKCDTGQTVILPTVTSGYQQTNITSTGGSSATGAPAIPVYSNVQPGPSTIAGIPTLYAFAAGGLFLAFLALRK